MKQRIKELEKQYREKEYELEVIRDEYNTYFYRISLCNSSDSYKNYIKENPNWKFQSCVSFKKDPNYLQDVILRIPKYLISKEDFLKEARKIVSPNVGNHDFEVFEYNNK